MKDQNTPSYWFASCPKGLEGLLLKELESFGLSQLRETVAGVEFKGDLESAYRVCLWSRLANRLLRPISSFPVASADELYAGVAAVNWTEHFADQVSIAIDFVGTGEGINNTQYGAQRVKDGIVDHFREATGNRPDVDLRQPDIRINARFAREKVTLSLDFSGDSLHKRGYRIAQTTAPLKENLAAALLIRAAWPGKHSALIDPMCGSGTLLIEGAMMAADIAPNLQRQRFGFNHWYGHQPNIWQALRDEATERRERGLQGELPLICGYDQDSTAVTAAQRNVEQAGLSGFIELKRQPISALQRPVLADGATSTSTGLLLTNPPYGARLGDQETLKGLYQELGDVLKREFSGWTAGVFTGNEYLGFALGLRSHKIYKLFNGAIPSQLLMFELFAGERLAKSDAAQDGGADPWGKSAKLSDGATMLANRLRKNQRKLAPWLKGQQINCYRLYDADLPEYAVAIDCYGRAIHVQEYEPPASIDASAARRRLAEVSDAVYAVLKPEQNQFFVKQRQRQRGDKQYQRLTEQSKEAGQSTFQVLENGARYEVNLEDYLDSGLFLDHRPVRKLLAELCVGKRFLNLFCYTATATVQAALGGASESLSIDMSNTYIDWAGRNLALNKLDTEHHKLLRADCLSWLGATEGAGLEGSFDVILLDPPTFSNSAKMDDVLDIQRDHQRLIEQCMGLLSEDGVLVFSNNFRRFKLDPALETRFVVENISPATIDKDFARRPRIHQCWLIRQRSE
ncbi:MAG: bifunctional 23S rRNA (guanine(2069)-N(7))-methyltransferase RlmK/23S rRNA (guanine(2445)-N(2))-methyltransferase RlmL [Gammaproteobacteria bacterium]|nr:bifunctional 23S rRNA (guanine(2069)-N(7))-methyltransferase RlmK/23S rRNA (guanine(2445)-N(2))-methyltransferase RlmL [Gammaproteobacteria bacterium]MBQ0840261.1 bifunctional 23S rRNA (guanine(2069)-N(7))-methyltransferase RlmK/23S rRNA (guanine(2445)-N(2))-methyltransferase RlmL [Gammaproteobacteria bacterium]